MDLVVEQVEKSFRTGGVETRVLGGVSFTLASGKSLALTGESGSGKSTLLHLIAGLDRIDQGRIALGANELASMGETELALYRRNTIGLVFQQFNLIPSLDLAGNLAFQARLADRYDPDWCATLTDRLGLAGLETRYPEELSGGQSQRVALGRVLAARPKLILADEPTGNLDRKTGDQVIEVLQSLADETDASLMVVTHSDRLAARLDRRLMLENGRLV